MMDKTILFSNRSLTELITTHGAVRMGFALLVLVATVSVRAGDDIRAEILGKVETYIAAYNAKDTARMSSVTVENFPVTSIRKTREGDRLTLRPFRQVKQQLEEEAAEVKEENWNASVLVDGPVAVVMLRHWLFLDGERHHCGTDVYNLLLLDGEWVITGLQYSLESDGCPEDQG